MSAVSEGQAAVDKPAGTVASRVMSPAAERRRQREHSLELMGRRICSHGAYLLSSRRVPGLSGSAPRTRLKKRVRAVRGLLMW